MRRCPCCALRVDVATRYAGPGAGAYAWQTLCDACLARHVRLQSCPHQEQREREHGTVLPILPFLASARLGQVLANAGTTVASARGGI